MDNQGKKTIAAVSLLLAIIAIVAMLLCCIGGLYLGLRLQNDKGKTRFYLLLVTLATLLVDIIQCVTGGYPLFSMDSCSIARRQ